MGGKREGHFNAMSYDDAVRRLSVGRSVGKLSFAKDEKIATARQTEEKRKADRERERERERRGERRRDGENIPHGDSLLVACSGETS